MANKPVYIPIELRVTDVDLSKVDLSKANKDINKKLASVKESVEGVFRGLNSSRTNKAIRMSAQSVINAYKTVVTAQERYNNALISAAKSSRQYKEALASANKELKAAKADYEALMAEDSNMRKIYEGAVRAQKKGLQLNTAQRQAIEQVENAQARLNKAYANMPDAKDFIKFAKDADAEHIDKVNFALNQLIQTMHETNRRGKNLNITVDANRYTEAFTMAQTSVKNLTDKLKALEERSQKMAALGATNKQWESLKYDAEQYKKELDEVIQRMHELINSGEAFRFGPLRGERVRLRGSLDALGSAGTGIFDSIMDRHTSATAPVPEPELSVWERFAKIGRGLAGGLVKNLQNAGKSILSLNKSGRTASSTLGKAFKKLGRRIMMFGLGFRSLYYLVKNIRNIAMESLRTMAGQFDEVNGPLSDLKTQFNQLKGMLGTALQPIITALLPMLQNLVGYLTKAAEEVAKFFAVLTGQDVIYKAKANLADYAKEAEKTLGLGGYDKLNVISEGQDKNSVEFEVQPVDKEEVEGKYGGLLDTLRSVGETINGVIASLAPLASSIFPTIEKILNLLLPLIQVIMPPITDLIQKLLPYLSDILEAIMPMLQQTLPPILEVLGVVVDTIMPVLVALIQQLSPIITKIIQILLPILEKLMIALQPIFNVIIESVLPVIVKLLDALMPLIEGILNAVMAILEPILALIAPLLEIVMDILDPILDMLAPLLDWLGTVVDIAGQLLGAILSLIAPLLDLIKNIFNPMRDFLWPLVGTILTGLVEILKKVATTITKIVLTPFQKLKDGIQKVSDVAGKIKSKFQESFDGARKAVENFWTKIKNIFNSILGGIEKMVNGVIKGINKMIDAINNISIDVPKWLEKLTGISTIGFNLKHINTISIPRLAQGAVIPPNKEFLAVLGDQKRGTNIEAPLDTIKQAVREVLRDDGYSQPNNSPILIQIDGRTVAEVVWDETEKRYKQTGRPVFAY